MPKIKDKNTKLTAGDSVYVRNPTKPPTRSGEAAGSPANREVISELENGRSEKLLLIW